MRWKRILLVPIALVTIIFVLALWGDEALTPGADAALRSPDRLARDANVFNPLAGFTVAASDVPAEAGHAAVTRVNALLDAAGQSEDLATRVQQAWIRPVLKFEDPEKLLCRLTEPGCLARLAKQREALRELAGKHAVLLTRYRELAAFPNYRIELSPHVAMPLPDRRALMDVHRLWLALQFVAALEAAPPTPAAILEDLRFMRRLLAQADDLLTKMVATALVRESLYVYAALMDAEGAVLGAFREIEPLTAQERSLEPALASEFRFGTSLLRGLDRGQVLQKDLGVPGWVGLSVLRPLFKPNRSVNAAYRCWQQAKARMARPPAALLAPDLPGNGGGCELPWYEWALNPIGTILVSIASPDGFSRPVTRLHDLDGAITLVNLKREIRRAGIGEDALPGFLAGGGARFGDPYTGAPARWDRESRALQFPSPNQSFNVLSLAPLSAQ